MSEASYLGRRTYPLIAVECVEYHQMSAGRWDGWGAYRTDEPGSGEQPVLAFYYPDCRREQFGER